MNDNLNKLYNIAFDLIDVILSKKEAIVPFTVTLEIGKTKPTVSMYEPFAKSTTEQLKIIRKDLRKMAENQVIKAMCLGYDVHVIDPRTNKKTDAILFELADEESGTTNIYIPYNFNDEDIIKKPFQISSNQKYF